MIKDRTMLTMLGLCAVILAVAALHLAGAILAPVAFALFIIALVWPMQRRLQARLPNLVALALTLLVSAIVVIEITSLVVSGFARVGHWLIANAGRFQTLYDQIAGWLEQHGIFIATVLADNFNAAWLIRVVQEVSSRLHDLISFLIVTFVFLMLGLLEVDLARRKIENLDNQETAQTLLRATADIAARFRRYMLVRSVMSVITGFVVWGFVSIAGLELARAWGVIAFALNYIPFIGPLVATVFPTLFAIAQFESWQAAVTVFLGLNIIQFLTGSYLEPRIAGAALSLSPFIVLFAVFFWSFLWGIPGAFIGIPIMIALHSLCAAFPASRWVAVVLSGRASGAA